MSKLPLSICVGAVGVFLCAPALADQTVVLKPVSGQAVHNGSSWVIVPANPPTSLSVTSMQSPRKAILEYPLSLPAGATITSASMSLEVTRAVSGIVGPGGPCQLTFAGYSGNGTIEPADAAVPSNTVGTTQMLYGAGTVSASLSVPYLQSLLNASGTHLGMMVHQTGDPTGEVRFASISLQTPELTVTYTPEPASLALVALASLVVTRRRRG